MTGISLNLAEARGVLADICQHTDATILAACKALAASPDDKERARAADLKHLIEGETT